MPDSLAELNQVEVVYRGRRVLGPLSLRVGAGAVVGVVGPNGAGKSTLLRLLAGLERPTRGQVRFFGSREPERGTWPWRLAPWRRRIALLLQHHDFCADMPLSVRDVVAFGTLPRIGAFWPRHRAEARAAVEAALHRLGIAALGGRLYRELSGGERQKVQMARVLAQGAELVLLDEPTAGLDLEWKERVTQLVAALRRDFGRTVVMVTHEVDRLPDNCTTVVLMPPGQTPRVGTPDELLTAAALGEVYGCRVQITRQGGRVLACAALPETGS